MVGLQGPLFHLPGKLDHLLLVQLEPEKSLGLLQLLNHLNLSLKGRFVDGGQGESRLIFPSRSEVGLKELI